MPRLDADSLHAVLLANPVHEVDFLGHVIASPVLLATLQAGMSTVRSPRRINAPTREPVPPCQIPLTCAGPPLSPISSHFSLSSLTLHSSSSSLPPDLVLSTRIGVLAVDALCAKKCSRSRWEDLQGVSLLWCRPVEVPRCVESVGPRCCQKIRRLWLTQNALAISFFSHGTYSTVSVRVSRVLPHVVVPSFGLDSNPP